jgi:hypothetical protein
MAKDAITPIPIAWDVIVFHHSRFPAVEASKTPTATIVPQDTVGVGKVITPALLICDGVVDPPVMADQPEDEVTATRA